MRIIILIFFGSISLGLFAQESLIESLSRSNELIRLENYDEAETLLESLLSRYPSRPEVYNNLAIVKLRKGDSYGAQLLLDEAMKTSIIYSSILENIEALRQYEAKKNYSELLDSSSESISLPELELIQDVSESVISNNTMPTLNNIDTNTLLISNNINDINSNTSSTLRRRLDGWVSAWSNGDAQLYMSYYRYGFATGDLTNEQWVQQRTQRIYPQRNINVSYSDLSISFYNDNKQAITTFRQDYKSSNFNSIGTKILTWELIDNQWYIISEESR